MHNLPSASSRIKPFALPLLFVVLYGSGFVGAKYGLPYCPPLTFLVLRFLIAACLAALIAVAIGAPWPKTKEDVVKIAVAGCLTVGVFSAGVFVAISLGLSPALAALIIALQPILVATTASHLLGENICLKHWVGLAMGLAGVAVVVYPKISFETSHVMGLAMAVMALMGLSFGNIYQKTKCSDMNIFTGGAIQSLASMLTIAPFAFLLETQSITWAPEFIAALAYMSVGVSIGALSLLHIMIRRQEISQVASIFYLIPVSAAIFSYIIFKENIDSILLIGATTIAIGVFLSRKS